MKKYFDLPFNLCIRVLELWLIDLFQELTFFLFLQERPTSLVMDLECIFIVLGFDKHEGKKNHKHN